MNTLVLDLGNSTLFAGYFRGDALVRNFRLPRDQAMNAAALVKALGPRRAASVEAIALCSVVPAQTDRLARSLRRAFGCAPLVLTANADHGLKIAYRRPAELGQDRLAAALGARKLYPRKHVITVDCGTATTVTLLSKSGELLGGAILPGLGLWAKMVAQRTAQLPEVPLRRPRDVVGRTTMAALQSGLLGGHTGAIRELVTTSRVEAFGRSSVVVIGTGGLVTHFTGQRLFTAMEPALILHGLQAFAARISSHA